MPRAAFLRLLMSSVALLPLAGHAEDMSTLGQVHSNIGQAEPFGHWLQQFRQDARNQGISEGLLDEAFDGYQPDERIVALDRKQPEDHKQKTFTEYLHGTASPSRIEEGRKLYAENRATLERIGAKYGVQPQFIVALWGVETSYGKVMGNYEVPQALATLAYEGRRADFFRTELIKSLQIVQQGNIPLREMKGSWAGAMGQSQFMPSSYLDYAVDENGDGRKDIWNTQEDVFGSIANYLSKSGWNPQHGWGRAVKLPAGFNLTLADGQTMRPFAEWQRLGVHTASGQSLPALATEAALKIPGTPEEGAFLVYDNYRIILKWNHSGYFATAVGILSDRIAEE